jgi:uroporphyrinogen-III synthase
MGSPDLSGFTVAVTADRRRDEQAVLLERLGLEVAMFPLLSTQAEDLDTLRALTLEICRLPPRYLIANTGYGMRTWFGWCSEWGVLSELVDALSNGTAIAARGAKALGELRKVGLDAFYKAPGETLDEVVGRLLEEEVAGKDVLVQLHGDGPGDELARLAVAGARVNCLSVYRTGTQGASEEALALASKLASTVALGSVDAVTFTAAPALEALFAVSEDERRALQAAFNGGGVVAACIGPVCAAKARALGVSEPLVPEHPRLGSLASGLGAHLAKRQVVLRGDHGAVRLSGRFAETASGLQVLSPVEHRALRGLLSRGGSVSSHALGATEAELSRLSERLDGVLQGSCGEWALALS